MGSMMHRVGGVVAAGAIAALAAGCSSGGSSATQPAGTASSASGAGSSATAAGSSSGTTGSSSGSSTGSATGGGAGAATPSAVATQGGPPACATKDLKVTIVNGQGAAGSVYQNIDFTNTGSATCSLYGYPGVSVGTGLPFKQVGAAANRASGTQAASPTLVTLAPGKTANAQLRVVEALNYPASKCTPTAVTYLQVYPPNQTAAVDLPFKSTGCANKSVNLLTIGAMQAGTVTNG